MRSARPGRAVGLVILALAVAAVGCRTEPGVTATDRVSTGGTSPSGDSGPATSPLMWGRCTDPKATDPTLQCATLAVPLDYSSSSVAANSIELSLVRIPASGPRQGSVLFNPGGPGASGFDPVAQSGATIQTQLGLGDFDLIGFDPRGVSRSGGIRCVDDAFQDAHLYLDDTPDTPAEQALLDEAAAGYVKGCKDHYGDSLAYYSTVNTARDMDRIREGLGDPTISYLGASYGTYLGGVYATLFPDRVRAMALDGAYEPTGDTEEQQYLTNLVGFEGAFNDWAAWCQTSVGCGFHLPDVGAGWDTLRQRLDDHPLRSASGRIINQSTMDVATKAALYRRAAWPVLGNALALAEQGKGDSLLAIADEYVGRRQNGTFDTLFQAIGIINCASGIEQRPPSDPAAMLRRIHQQAPRMGHSITLKDLTDPSGRCSDLMPPQRQFPVKYSGNAPIVVVGGTKDPATPIRWATEMTTAMGDSARMVTYTGEGHGALLVSKCVSKIEGTVLSKAQLPDRSTVCEPDPTVTKPTWWVTVPAVQGARPADLPAVSAALGLTDTDAYFEIRLADPGSADTDRSYTAALIGAQFRDLGTVDLKIPHTIEHGWQAPNGNLLVVIVMDRLAFDTDALHSAKAAVPPGKTVVMLAYLPQ